jgi:hypothetical protein
MTPRPVLFRRMNGVHGWLVPLGRSLTAAAASGAGRMKLPSNPPGSMDPENLFAILQCSSSRTRHGPRDPALASGMRSGQAAALDHGVQHCLGRSAPAHRAAAAARPTITVALP